MLVRLQFLRGCLIGCSEPDSDGQRRYRLLPRLVAPSPTAPAPQGSHGCPEAQKPRFSRFKWSKVGGKFNGPIHHLSALFKNWGPLLPAHRLPKSRSPWVRCRRPISTPGIWRTAIPRKGCRARRAPVAEIGGWF